MLYKSSEIPSNFNKVADISDNYIIFSKESKLISGRNYEVYIQYFKPNFYVLHLLDYQIRDGAIYTIDYNFATDSLGTSYLDSADVSFEINTFTSDSFSGDELNMADYLDCFNSGVLILIIFLFGFYGLSKLWKRRI